ncbi:MAG: hypothetical protein NTZ55_03570 [Candidatus Roizmanbacteria bacterium]|nr:hypothetical protein [Candidatus Roizmanbacteria bacterium]
MDRTDQGVNSQLLFSWKAPLRAYKRRSNSILRFYIALALLLSLIVFFFGDKVLLVPILTLLFLFYVLTITPPPEIENIITVFGIETAGVTLRWEFLSHFYYTKKFHFDVLTLVSNAPYYYHAYLIVPDEEIKKSISTILSKHVMYVEKPQRSFTDKVVDWLSNLMPEDEDLGQEHPSSHQKPLETSLSPQKVATI